MGAFSSFFCRFDEETRTTIVLDNDKELENIFTLTLNYLEKKRSQQKFTRTLSSNEEI